VSSDGAIASASRPADLLRRVQLIELRARRLVMDLLAGPYRSVFRGRGLEFADIREYQPGDDVRAIDWHATARSGTVQIKQNIEERCLTLMLAVDLSASGDFGSGAQSKRELAAELAACFALSAVSNNDRLGLLLFTDSVEHYLPPRTGRRQALAIVSAILSHPPRSRRTSLDRSLRTLGALLRQRATLVLLSDFLDTGFERALRLVSLRHDVIAVSIQDAVESTIPPLGWLVCEDAETGSLVEIDTDDPGFQHSFQREHLARTAALQDCFRRSGVDWLCCQPGIAYQRELLNFLNRRQQQLARRREPSG
jgi:uncharacterized protein (DUF58 family)